MRAALVGAVLGVAAASEGGSLKLNWSDCGDSSTHGHITSLEPTTVPLGTKTSLAGKGSLDEVISGATYKVVAKALGITVLSHTGDACKPDTIMFPGGAGQIDMKGFNCPLSAGDVELDLDMSLSASIPASLARVSIDLTATATSGDKMLCVKIKTVPASDLTIHPERAAQIEELAAMPGMTWQVAAHPRFANKAPGASKDLCGVKGNQKEIIAAAIESGEITRFVSAENFVAPDSFDSEANWPQCAKVIGDIRDQSNCGCCWAFAGAEAASDRMCIATNASLLLPLSAQDVCFNSNFDGCDGGQISTPWSYIKRTGVVTGSQQQPGDGKTDPFKGMGLCSSFSLPHCHHHGPTGADPYPAEGAQGCASQSSPQGPTACDSGAKAPHNDFKNDKYTFSGQVISPDGESSLQQAIMEGGPLEVAFTVYSDFENYAGGIYQHKSGGMAGGHAVKMVGWGVENGVKYWKIANSWNPYWGEKGYFRIIRGQDEGGIESQATGSAANAKWGKKSSSVVV